MSRSLFRRSAELAVDVYPANMPATSARPSAYLSARAAAKVCGVSERTIRNWVRAGRLSAEKSDGTFRIARDQLEQCVAESARTSATAERNGADSAADPQTVPAEQSALALVELVHLVDRLQRENRDLAGLVGSLQERVTLLSLPSPTMAEMRVGSPSDNAAVEPTEAPAETPKPRPWWHFWR